VEQEALKFVPDALALCGEDEPTPKLLAELRKVVAVMRCIDRIEIRGRDSAGIAVQVAFASREWHGAFRKLVESRGLGEEARRRTSMTDLPALAVHFSEGPANGRPSATFFYKVAAEVGRLGDNVAELRRQVSGDRLLRLALSTPESTALVLGHTRWAS